MTSPMPSTSSDAINRRVFLGNSLAVAAAAAIPGGAHAAGSDLIRIGLVGCGGRGLGAAMQAVSSAPGVVITALGDRFADQVQSAVTTLGAACGPQFAPAGLFHGVEAAAAVIASDVDAVILASPPCFRPAELEAVVRHGRHAYAEAPVGVDAAGVRAAAAAVQEGLRRGLSLASGLHSRQHDPMRQAVAAISAGAIGSARHATVAHHLGLAWHRPLRPDVSTEEATLRNWVVDERLSGGPFLADLVHAIDRAVWALGEPTPVDATASASPVPLPAPAGDRSLPQVRIRFLGGQVLDASVVRRQGIDMRVTETVTGDAGVADLRVPLAGSHAASMASFVGSLRGGSRRDDLAVACRSTMLGVLAGAAVAGGGRPVAWGSLWRPATAAGPA